MIAQDLKILVADDEALARKRILQFLQAEPETFHIREATTGKETIELVHSFGPDLLFLDIKMTDMTGFDVLEQIDLQLMPVVVFVTAFDQFAVRAFEVQAVDFLLKPYKRARFKESLERAMDQVRAKDRSNYLNKLEALLSMAQQRSDSLDAQPRDYLQRLVLKKNKQYYFVPVTEIKMVQADGSYVVVHTKDQQTHLHRMALSALARQLDPKQYTQVNRSSLVNLSFIDKVVSEGKGEYSLILKDGSHVNLSASYRKELLNLMGIK